MAAVYLALQESLERQVALSIAIDKAKEGFNDARDVAESIQYIKVKQQHQPRNKRLEASFSKQKAASVERVIHRR